MKLYKIVVNAIITICYISNAGSAGDLSLLYRIGYSDQISKDLRLFDRDADYLLADLILSADGKLINPDDFAASFQIAWNDDNLLLYIEVSDNEIVVNNQNDQLWANDSVEIFLCPLVSGSGYYQLILAVDAKGDLKSFFYDFRDKKDVPLQHQSAGLRTEHGYRIMTQLPWSNIGISPSIVTEIGIQIFANDSDSGQSTRQWQWYPHSVSHSCNWMHRLQLQQKTADKHLLNYQTSFSQSDLRMDIYAGRDKDLTEFDILDNHGRKVAVGCLQKISNGLKKSSVILPIQESWPLQFRFLHNGIVIGKAAVANPGSLDTEQIRALQNITIVPKAPWGYIFETGKRPEITWSDEGCIRSLTANKQMQVTWFDKSLNEVQSFDKSGRYLAYAQVSLADGRILRRSATFYAIDKGSHPWRDDTRIVLYNRSRPWWHPWRGGPYARMDYLPGLGIEPSAWEAGQYMISAWAGKAFFDFLENDPYGPVLLSFLSESGLYDSMPMAAQTPEIVNDEIHLRLKRHILKAGQIKKPLVPPQNVDTETPLLRVGTPKEAGFAENAPQQIRDFCRTWYEESGEPFAVLIAKEGVIFFHEPFGKTADGTAVTLNTPMFMASITKFMSGMLLAQFVDQGLIRLDDPVGRFLPELPTEGEKTITFRHCFTHTTGLTGHYEFGGMHNPWLENAIWLGLKDLPVGRVHEYNGMGYDLAGKALEMAVGKTAFLMMHEYLFEPLGMSHTVLDDMATCSTSTPMDIAHIGQLILNEGTYGGKRFFSPETLKQLLPCELNPYIPAVQKNWGIGMTWMNTEDPEAQITGRRHLFSSLVIGHGAASSAIFRVDLENRLIVVQTRNQAGRNYDTYMPEFLKIIDRLMLR